MSYNKEFENYEPEMAKEYAEFYKHFTIINRIPLCQFGMLEMTQHDVESRAGFCWENAVVVRRKTSLAHLGEYPYVFLCKEHHKLVSYMLENIGC